MKKIEKLTAALFVLLTLALLSSVGYAQQSQAGAGTPLQLLASEERIVKLAYMKLSLYNRAANAQRAVERKILHNAEDDIRFVIQNIHTGPIEEIYDRPYGELVTRTTGDIVLVIPGTISHNNGPKHAEYGAHWVDAMSIYHTVNWDNITVREALLRDTKFADVGKYTSYEVTIRLAGKQRTYRAMFLYHGPLQSALISDVEIQDNVVGSFALANALAEKLPPVRSPWNLYVNSPAHRALSSASMSAQGNYDGKALAKNDEQEGQKQTSSGFLLGDMKGRVNDRQEKGKVHLAFAQCSVGEIIDDTTGMCCDNGTMQCCFAYDPNNGWCDESTCGYPDCNPQPVPGTPPPTDTCSCTAGSEYYNPKQIGFDDFTKHFPNGTRHSGWMQTQGHCDTLCSCAVDCAVDPWGDPPNGVWDDGKDSTWDGLNHVPTPQTSRQTATANKGGTATCGFAFGVGWVACVDTTCTANVTISWSGISYSINSAGFYTGALQDTLTCKSPSP